MTSTKNIASGSCLCKKVSYRLVSNMGDIVHCHCETCRKAHGSAFSSVLAVKDEDFILSGREHCRSFESSPGKHRYFCSYCGTQVYAKRENTQHIILRLGSLDGAVDAKEHSHIWVSQKASWYAVESSLPMHETFE